MIKPTIGRVVWFTPSKSSDIRHDKTQPLTALIAYVWGDTCVNLAAFDQNGVSHNFCSVTLLQDGQEALENGYYAEWMPYQKGQAAKTEALEAAAKAAG